MPWTDWRRQACESWLSLSSTAQQLSAGEGDSAAGSVAGSREAGCLLRAGCVVAQRA